MLGLLLLDKPQDITSFGAVARIKRLAGEKRVGHTGTLDPMATGVLPILIGRATVLSQYLIEADKSYTAIVKLGIATDSCDITGEVISERKVNVTEQDIDATLQKFLGKQMQVPPMFSAIKQNGVRMYELARRGETVEIPAREIEVFSLDKTSSVNEDNEFQIDCNVSKGTYIRSLARDIAAELGTNAVMSSLLRTQSGYFTLDKAIPFSLLESDPSIEELEKWLIPTESVLPYEPLLLDEKQSAKLFQGQQVRVERENGLYKIYKDGGFYGIAEVKDGLAKAKTKLC